MTTTGTVLYVRTGLANGGGPGALDVDFDVVVADGAIDAVKRLTTQPQAPDCLVTSTTVHDLPLDAFVEQVSTVSPETSIVVVGEPPTDPDVAAALVEADAYLPPGREGTLPDRVRRLLGRRRVDRAVRRHDRLARAISAIAVDVAATADREAVESAVHDRLVEANAYRHVWVARRDEDGHLDVSAPVAGRLDEDELGALVGGGDPSFVSRAVETGQVVSTEGRVPTRGGNTAAATATETGTAYDGGASDGLATAAVPFVHEGGLYGVGLVSTGYGDAFDGSERELLSDLGSIVGHALWAVDVGGRAGDPSASSGGADVTKGLENLVHELRNPLGVAQSYLEIAREDDDLEPLDRVESALTRMADTVDQAALGIRGTRAVKPEPGALEEDVNLAWESIETPEAALDVESSARVRADHELLVRLLANLFQNAVEHAKADVTVRVGTVPGGFYVEDDGPGIPKPDREAVFERGYSTGNDGLGIGLSIVEDVANTHGWTLSLAEGDDGGARFEVTGVEVVEGNESAGTGRRDDDDI